MGADPDGPKPLDLNTLPNRRFLLDGGTAARDDFGFFLDDPTIPAVGIEELFSNSAVLVVAPPWTGKSFVARQLEAYFRQAGGSSEPRRFQNYHLTKLQNGVSADVTPDWWEPWRRSEQRAVWIVDSVDEERRTSTGRIFEALDRIKSLDVAERRRLTLLLFCRESEVPERVKQELDDIYGERQEVSLRLRTVVLAPLDAAAACDLLEKNKQRFRNDFDAVRRLIQENHLKHVAGLPCVVECLGAIPADAKIAVHEMWRVVIANLLMGAPPDSLCYSDVSTEERLAAAERLAATLTLSGETTIRAGGRITQLPSIDTLLPVSNPASRILNRAGKEVLASAVFVPNAEGFRIREWHVQEWLTAFALAETPLNRLKPVAADGNGKPFPEYRGLLALLYLCTQHLDVQNWIVESYGGVVPRSDAAPPSLSDAIAALNQLLTHARRAEIEALSMQGSLRWLSTPGFGAILADRLGESSLSIAERILVLDLALTTRATECALLAEAIFRDQGEAERLRSAAVVTFGAVATDAQLISASGFIESSPPTFVGDAGIKLTLIYRLLRRRLWTLAECIRSAPVSTIEGARSFFWQFTREMRLEDARQLLALFDDARFQEKLKLEVAGVNHYPDADFLSTIARAVELIAEQLQLAENDFELLTPLATSDMAEALEDRAGDALRRALSTVTDARREAFWATVERTPGRRSARAWLWQQALGKDDIEWLIAHAAERPDVPWLWNVVLDVTYAHVVDSSERESFKARVRAASASVLADYDASQQQAIDWQAQHEAERRARKAKEDSERFSLESLVLNRLESSEMTLHDKMLDLGWFCSSESTRPQNILGEWENLSEPLKDRVIDLFERALKECEPTEIPSGNTYPGGVVHEPECFQRAIERGSPTYLLDREQIRKWLPATLIFGIPDRLDVISKCISADRQASEKAIVKEIRRQVSQATGPIWLVSNLPQELWSDQLSSQCAGIAGDDTLPVQGRASLLDFLSTRAADLAIEIANRWADASSGPPEQRAAKRVRGLNLLLQLSPEYAWSEIYREFKAGNKTLISEMHSLDRFVPSQSVGIDNWSATSLSQLYEVLDEIAPSPDPRRSSNFVARVHTLTDTLRGLHARIPGLLYKCHEPGDAAVVAKMAEVYPKIKDWIAYVEAQTATRGVLAQFEPTTSAGLAARAAIPVEKVVRFFEDSAFRLIRSSEDLQQVLLEELSALAKDARKHLSLLYTPRKSPHQKPLHEDALQAYICCRLNDRLRGRVLDPAPFIHRNHPKLFLNREPQMALDERFDLLIEAETLDGGAASVVIEIKWSRHPKIAVSLEEQLGGHYLIGNGLTHGIYLVGWCGCGVWPTSLPKASKPARSIQGLQAWLDAQAKKLTVSNVDIHIVAVVMDLYWPPT